MGMIARIETRDLDSALATFNREAESRMRRAALVATDRASKRLLTEVRGAMTGAGLGRLGNALGATSDLRRGAGVHSTGNGAFSASGSVLIRSGSQRSRGAIISYTEGRNIRPTRGRWLWVPTPDLPRISMRYRLTPEAWRQNGLDRRIGPLVMIRSINGRPLLVVRNVGVALSGARGSVKSLKKNGEARRGQVAKEFLVAFVGIPSTARAARIDVRAIAQSVAADLPALFAQALEGKS